MIKGIAFAAALIVTAPAYAGGGFGAGFGQGIGQQFGGMQPQPYYYVPQPQQSYQNQMFYPQQQRYTFPNGSLNCTTFQGAFGSQTTCR